MRDNGWEATFEKEYGGGYDRSNWSGTIRREYHNHNEVKPLPDIHDVPCHPHQPPPPNNTVISLFDFIDNKNHDVLVGPPTSPPTKDTLYGPWVENSITYLSVGANGVWKHIKLSSSITPVVPSGVYGSKTAVPVLEFNEEGLIVGLTVEDITFDVNIIPDSGVIAGVYGSVTGNVAKIPSITVNDKGFVTNVVEESISISSDMNFVFEQTNPAPIWSITHNMGKYPSVTVIDSANNIIIGEVHYDSTNSLTVSFSGGFSGKAILN